jgi:hypothetical protein
VGTHPEQLVRLQPEVGHRALSAGGGLVQEHSRVPQGEAPSGLARREENRGGAGVRSTT